MEKREIKNDRLPYLAFPWALSVKNVSEWLFISGTPPMDVNRKVVTDDFIEQFEYEVARVRENLEAAGMTVEDIVFLGITVTEKADIYNTWDAFAKAYLKHFPATPGPAGGTMRVVSGLTHPKMLVEIEAIAAR